MQVARGASRVPPWVLPWVLVVLLPADEHPSHSLIRLVFFSSLLSLSSSLLHPVHSCRNLASRVLVGEMDPFCVLHLSNSKDEKFKVRR